MNSYFTLDKAGQQEVQFLLTKGFFAFGNLLKSTAKWCLNG